jgi:hypothetical protein
MTALVGPVTGEDRKALLARICQAIEKVQSLGKSVQVA